MKVEKIEQTAQPVARLEVTQDELDKLIAVIANCHTEQFQGIYDALKEAGGDGSKYIVRKFGDGSYIGTIEVKESNW